MAENLSVSWNEYQKNICKGLCGLQQRGEFVDMTLAAEGHHVKVHQMVMSLVSPYIKDLISSANCPHPVIFLNRVSYKTMQAILEYAYTGEVVVSKDKMGEFLEACMDLHIKGLENMLKEARTSVSDIFQSSRRKRRKSSSHEEKIVNFSQEDDFYQTDEIEEDQNENTVPDKISDTRDSAELDETKCEDALSEVRKGPKKNIEISLSQTSCRKSLEVLNNPAPLQYSVSIYGNLQIVLNRYLYSFIHVRKNNQRYWRCINQQKTGCLAFVTTVEEKIVERGHPHNHAFHDAQILKRIKNGNMFTSVNEVENAAAVKKQKRDEVISLRKASNTTDV